MDNVKVGRFLSRMDDAFKNNHPAMLLRNDGPLANLDYQIKLAAKHKPLRTSFRRQEKSLEVWRV